MRGGGNLRIDYRSVSAVTGYMLLTEMAMLLLPAAVSLCSGEDFMLTFLLPAGVCGAAGGALVLAGGPGRQVRVNRREGYLLTSVVWVVYSLAGMLPFMLMPGGLGVTDAFFETMSGFTTTGATVLPDVEALGRGILFWRSLTQWVGGLGIVLFMLVVLPALNQSGGVSMFNAETTGIRHDKLHPRIRQTAQSLWTVYGLLTVALIVLLWAGPMDLFDAVCHGLTTISTGGFSTRNAGIASWDSDYVAWVETVFMLAGGVNLMLLYGVFHGRWRALWNNDVFRTFALTVAAAWVAVAVTLLVRGEAGTPAHGVLYPLFHVSSAVTSTGFALGDYEAWGSFVFLVTLLLMSSGACAGSTSGGIKMDRLVVIVRNIRKEIELMLYPNHTVVTEINGQGVPSGHINKVSAFFTLYVGLLTAGAAVMCCYGYGFGDSIFAAVSCIGNNGLGYGVTGASGGFGTLPDVVKWVLSALMLVGRLELFTVVAMFARRFWKPI